MGGAKKKLVVVIVRGSTLVRGSKKNYGGQKNCEVIMTSLH